MQTLREFGERIRDFYNVHVKGMHRHQYVSLHKGQDMAMPLAHDTLVILPGLTHYICLGCETEILASSHDRIEAYERRVALGVSKMSLKQHGISPSSGKSEEGIVKMLKSRVKDSREL